MPISAAAILAALLFLIIAVFQLLLALGLPFGEAAWGGRHRVLPPPLRVASAVALVIWLMASFVVLERGALLSLGLDRSVTQVLVWMLTFLLAVGTLANAMSRSKRERLIWTPIAAAGCLLCLFLAIYS